MSFGRIFLILLALVLVLGYLRVSLGGQDRADGDDGR